MSILKYFNADIREYSTVDIFSKESQFAKQANKPSICIYKSKVSNPTITIAIPTYKRVEALEEAIESAINQIDVSCKYDVIVVDDNPERDDVTEKFMQKYENTIVSYYKNSKNLKAAGNWNRLYELANAEWVVMLHDDDVLVNSYISKVYPLLNDQIDYIYFDNIIFNSTLPNLEFRDNAKLKRMYLHDAILGDPVHIAGNIMRKSSVIELGGFNAEMFPNFDHAFWSKIFCYKKCYYYNQPLAYYRIAINDSTNPKIMSRMERALYHTCLEDLKKLGVSTFVAKLIQIAVNKNQVEATKKLFIPNYESDFLEPISNVMYRLSSYLGKRTYQRLCRKYSDK